MSQNRENVTWQSADGTWSIGFFDHSASSSYSDDDYGYDDEWDREYSDKFHWVSTGHTSPEAAGYAWSGANPGTGSTVPYGPDTKDRIAGYDDQAAQTHEASLLPYGERDLSYYQPLTSRGTPKKRTNEAIAKEFYSLKAEAYRVKLAGYANPPSSKLPRLAEELNRRAAAGEPGIKEAIESARVPYLAKLQTMLPPTNARREESSWYKIGSPERARLEKEEAAIAAVSKEIQRVSTPVESKAPQGSAKKEVSITVSGSGAAGAPVSTSGQIHITPTGQARTCKAEKGRCPYGGAGDHFSTKEQARAAYEKKQGGSFGGGLKKQR